MVQYESTLEERPTPQQRMRLSAISTLVGGGLLMITGIALLSVLTEAEFAFVSPIGIIASILIALGLPAFYASEHRWFGRLAIAGFWTMTVGWVIATVALPIADYGPGVAFIPTLLGWLVAFLGALVLGVAILRSDAATTPRLGAWLLVAALPIGLPFAIAFTTYVMGEGADPWAGPFLLYGLAWVVFGRYLRSANGTRTPSTEVTSD